MTTGATGQLGLALPVQGELSGTWGDTVNNGITQYTNIAIAGTLTLTDDGAVTLTNTTGDASASNITSSLTGAGTVTAQFAIVKIAGTLTTTKVVTFGSAGSAPYSKTFMVVNAATGGTVTFKAYGQTGVSIAVGESAWVYYNGTDIVKIAGTSSVASFSAGTTGLTPSSATTGAITLAGTLATANGGTNLTSFTSGGAMYATSTSVLTTGTLPVSAGGTNASSAGITAFNNITGYTASGATGTTSTNLVFSTSPTLVTPILGTPTSGTLSNCTVDGTTSVGFLSIPQNSQSAAYTTVLADSGKCIYHPTTDANARTFTIASNASVPYPVGTVIQFVNMTSQVVTIAINSDTMYLAGTGTTGSRSLAIYGVANAMKMTATTWIITGSGLT